MHQNANYLKWSVEHDLILIKDWFRVNKLSLNLNKTIYVSFHGKKLIDKLRFSNISLPIVKDTKILGVHINESLNWHKHFNELFNKLFLNKRLLTVTKLHLSEKAKRNLLLCTYIQSYIIQHIGIGVV